MITRHVEYFLYMYALNGFLEQLPILGNNLRILLGCLDHRPSR
jgi:hypothetical protein